MSETNENDAPYGHITVKPRINSGGMPVCDGCAGYNRADHQDVIFKPAG